MDNRTSSTALDLSALKALAEKATPGPWDVSQYVLVDQAIQSTARGIAKTAFPHDAEFIAAFDPPTVLALLARVEEAEDRITRTLEWLEENRPMRCTYASPEESDDSATLIYLLTRGPTDDE